MKTEGVPTSTGEEARITRLVSDRLSLYRTKHEFQNYGEFTSLSEFEQYLAWAKQKRLPLVIVGAGSNMLFGRYRVRALVLKNRMPKELTELGPDRLQATATVMLAQVLKWCEERGLDSFYYRRYR